MKKIPTLFLRDENDRSRVTDKVHPACQWVLDGEGVATAKFDGMCAKLDEDGRWWKRREVKRGKSDPPGFVLEADDPVTGKRFGWVEIGDGPDDAYFREAIELYSRSEDSDISMPRGPGTYELVGPKVQGNPHMYSQHDFVRHGVVEVSPPPDRVILTTMMRDYLEKWPYEGIVWHHPDGRMAKIKRRDYGLPWPKV